MRMQGIVLLGAFLRLTPYARNLGMSDDEVFSGVERALRKYFGKRGERVVQDNLNCVKRGYQEMQEVPTTIIRGTRACYELHTNSGAALWSINRLNAT
jgi:pyruvate-ferredoxin/flavodoxin oxidoreductase